MVEKRRATLPLNPVQALRSHRDCRGYGRHIVIITIFSDANGGHRKSNADAIIGRVGKVTETIKVGDYGRMKLDGDDWKAESDETEDLPVGTKVRIVGRESIIVKVEKA